MEIESEAIIGNIRIGFTKAYMEKLYEICPDLKGHEDDYVLIYNTGIDRKATILILQKREKYI